MCTVLVGVVKQGLEEITHYYVLVGVVKQVLEEIVSGIKGLGLSNDHGANLQGTAGRGVRRVVAVQNGGRHGDVLSPAAPSAAAATDVHKVAATSTVVTTTVAAVV